MAARLLSRGALELSAVMCGWLVVRAAPRQAAQFKSPAAYRVHPALAALSPSAQQIPQVPAAVVLSL